VLWNLKQGKELHRWRAARGFRGVFAPDGRSVIIYDTILRRWDVATGELLYADVSKVGSAPFRVFSSPGGHC
jgi:hypothetical protein